MKNLIKNLFCLIIVLAVFSCSDDYFDVNKPENAIDPNTTALKNILGPAILYSMNANYQANLTASLVTQNIVTSLAENDIDNHYPDAVDSFWNTFYLDALANLKLVEKRASTTNSSHYKGIAQTLIAINIGLATDLYGDIPYSEAAKSGAIITPKYDSQQSVYNEVNTLLSSAIANFTAPNTSAFAPGAEDLIYGGDMSKWLKAAYSFRAKYALHLTKRNGTTAYTTVLSDLANGFASNNDDFQMKYNAVLSNPWHTSQLALRTGNANVVISKHFVSYMNGNQFPFSTVAIDPRLPKLVDLRVYPNYLTNPGLNPLLPASYLGATNGLGQASSNTKIGIDLFYSKTDSPLVIMSYSEAKLIEAEARFILGGGSSTSTGSSVAAYSAYIAGINANHEKVGVAATDTANYLADTSVNVGNTNLALKDIMRQKFITLFLNTETFNDYRRYDFSTNVFPNLTIPATADPKNGGNWIRRFIYPVSEKNNNTTNYDLNKKTMTTKVWWDL